MVASKKYKLRHKLLGILLKKFDSITVENSKHKRVARAEDAAILVEVLAKELNISVHELQTITPPLVRAEEIKVDDFGNGICVYAWTDSQTAYDENKYIEIGKKKFNDEIYDIVKWALPLALISVSIFTTCINIQLNKDKQDTQTQIEQINKQLDTLRELKKSEYQILVSSDSMVNQKIKK